MREGERRGDGEAVGLGAFGEELEALKAASTAQVLFQAARLLHEHAMEMMRAQLGLDTLRDAHVRLFPYIELEGTRLTTLADRLGVSKQAAGQLVEELVGFGVLERVADPTDGRAKLIRFREDGPHTLVEGMRLLRGVDAQLEAALGPEAVSQLREQLAALVVLVERGGLGTAISDRSP